MNKLYIALLLLVMLSCAKPDKAQQDPFLELTGLIDQYSKGIVNRGNISTMSVAVYKNGKTYHNYYGDEKSLSMSLPNDSSLFEIASITKIFTGSLVAKAVSEGKLSLDTDIRIYLPHPYPNLQYENKPVTVKDLVTHTLGFQTPKKLQRVYQNIFAGRAETNPIAYSIGDLFDELKTVELISEPGTVYQYNNVGPDIAAYILAQIYKKPFSVILQGFLDEIGLKNTHLQEYGKYSDRLVKGYTEDGQLATVDENPLLGGSSGIITTLPDLAKFMRYYLESDAPFIQESTRKLFEDEDEIMGYLWDLGYADVEGFYHIKSGTSNGLQSILLICPDSDYGQILLMTNTDEAATNDWLSLYNRIEYDLIKYPKINLWSKMASDFLTDPEAASNRYHELRADTATYFAESDYLNRVGYDFIFRDQLQTAVQVFKLAISADPENADLYDSLGEAYFRAKDYEKSIQNYEQSLRLDLKNSNAEAYLKKMRDIMAESE